MRRVALAVSVLLLAVGCQQAAKPASSSTVAVQASADSDTFKQEQAAKQRYANRDDVYFSYYEVAEDDVEPANPIVATMASGWSKFEHFFAGLFKAPIDAFKFYVVGDRPAVAARKMEDSASPDTRREGINQLLEYNFTKRPPYTVRYRQIAQFDPDSTVRAIAIRASNRARDVQATPVFVQALNDKSELVRLEAAKALVRLPDPNAQAPLMQLLGSRDENRDVQIAAADALKHYHNLTVARALAAALGDKDFSVAWQARRSLVYLTGRDFGYAEGTWLSYFTGPDKPFG